MEQKKDKLKILYLIFIKNLKQHLMKKGKMSKINCQLQKYIYSIKKNKISIIIFFYTFLLKNNIFIDFIQKKKMNKIKSIPKIKQINNIIKKIKKINIYKNINKKSEFMLIEKNKFSIK